MHDADNLILLRHAFFVPFSERKRMSLQNLTFEDDYKKLGFEHFSQNNFESVERLKSQPYIKVLYVPVGYELP